MAKELYRVHPGGGIYQAVEPRISHPLSYFRNYAQLFHNTDEAGARGILQSGSIWARPISDFSHEDQEEYRHGLIVLRDGLVPRVADLEAWMPDFPNFAELRKLAISSVELAHRVADYIAREVAAFDSGRPYLQIFIACFSEGQAAGKFGVVQLKLSPLLPVVAYAHPAGAFASGISRVAYFDDLLLSYAVGQLTRGSCLEQVLPLLKEGRFDAAAARLALEFMVLAPNLKRADYSAEREWRLKIVFQDLPELQSMNDAHLNRARIGCQSNPSYTAHTPRRLIHPLSIDGRGIINGVKIIDANGEAARSPELDALRLTYCMPQTNAFDAARLIEARGLTAGNATFADLAQAVSQRPAGETG